MTIHTNMLGTRLRADLKFQDGLDLYEIIPDEEWLDTGRESHRREDGALLIYRSGVGIRWALFEWWCSTDDAQLYRVVAHGEGTDEPLREARHTFFGEDGYVSYVDGALLSWAFGKLARYFDGMVDA